MKPSEYSVKQVIVVRNDIKMSKGKIAAQVAHAAVASFYNTLLEKRDIALRWLDEGQPKIVVKVSNLSELKNIMREAEERGIITTLIRDAGHTELEPGTVTCLGIGPDYSDLIDEVTGELPLL
jgi:PTH2 family peptidyl-tRNA hydrolase